MITKKCLTSLITFAISLLLIFAAVYFMSIFTVNKWVGLGVGAGVLVLLLVIYCAFRKKWRWLPLFTNIIAYLATGITISSLFVLYGSYPPIWQTAVLYACLIAAFYLYCLCTNIPFLQDHCRIPLIIYALLLLTAAVLLYIFLEGAIYILAIMSLIPLVALLISLSIEAKDIKEHFKNLTFCSFGILFVAVLVVLIVLSEGDGLDSLDFGGGGGTNPKKQNPYDYLLK